MPRLSDPAMTSHTLAKSAGSYSAVKIAELGASEYTLVQLVVDGSPSVDAFKKQMVDCVKAVIQACQYSPKADNLLVRVCRFDSNLDEHHGFKPLSQCDLASYNNMLDKSGGGTALYAAFENGILSTQQYGAQLVGSDFTVNAILFVITDGCDNASHCTISDVKNALTAATVNDGRNIESLKSILVGVNVQDAGVSTALQTFYQQAGLTQYVELDKATDKALAKLADFVSRSISSQSKALGSGQSAQSQSLKI